MLHARWLSHTLTEHLMRQVQQQRWQLPGTLAPVTSLSQLRLRPFNASARQLLADLGRRISFKTGEARETSYLFQRISVSVQRFDAVLLHDSLPYCLVNFRLPWERSTEGQKAIVIIIK